MSKEKTAIGQRLETVRKMLNASKEDFSSMLGYAHPNSYHNIITGNTGFSLSLINLIHEKINWLNLHWLLTGEGSIRLNDDKISCVSEPQAGYNSNVLLERVKGLEEQIKLKDEIISLLKR